MNHTVNDSASKLRLHDTPPRKHKIQTVMWSQEKFDLQNDFVYKRSTTVNKNITKSETVTTFGLQ